MDISNCVNSAGAGLYISNYVLAKVSPAWTWPSPTPQPLAPGRRQNLTATFMHRRGPFTHHKTHQFTNCGFYNNVATLTCGNYTDYTACGGGAIQAQSVRMRFAFDRVTFTNNSAGASPEIHSASATWRLPLVRACLRPVTQLRVQNLLRDGGWLSCASCLDTMLQQVWSR